jgi:hypothetical protein
VEPKQRQQIIQALRKQWMYSPQYRAALKRATVVTKALGGRRTTAIRCACCEALEPREAVAVDHVSPVVCPDAGFGTWDEFISRLFENPLQVLCVSCHAEKTAEENLNRRK